MQIGMIRPQTKKIIDQPDHANRYDKATNQKFIDQPDYLH